MKKLLFIVLLLSLSAQAQLWSGILSNSRGSNYWASSGADPQYMNEVRTKCGSTIATIGTSVTPAAPTAINTAITSCAAAHPLSGVGGYVELATGSFYLNNTIQMANNVTLRGAGANLTTLFYSGSAGSCAYFGAAEICIRTPTSSGLGYDASKDNEVNWTAGFAGGTTSITVSGFTNLKVGSLVFLDQRDTDNSPVPATGLEVCRGGACGGDNVSGRPQDGTASNPADGRSLTEPQVVTSCGTSTYGAACTSATVGITPGIRTPNWFRNTSTCGNNGTLACAPQMWWNNDLPIQRVGIENLRLDSTADTSRFSRIQVFGGYNVWVKNVAFTNTHGNAPVGGWYDLFPVQSMRVTMWGSYAVGSPPLSDYYMMSCWTSGDMRFEANISQHIAFSAMDEGCINFVKAYNFGIDGFYTAGGGSEDWQQSSGYRHGGTDALGLFEGNEGTGVVGDEVFGASNLFTVFRSFYSGRDPEGGAINAAGKDLQTDAVLLYPPNRFWSFIGNVLGTGGYHTVYSCSAPSTTGKCNDFHLDNGNQLAIFEFGYPGGYASVEDSYTGTSSMRWGNFDTVNNAVRWVSGEVPSGLSDGFANAVPATQVLPPSFLYASQPGWWPAGYPWPPIGPDVTCLAPNCITSGSGAASTLGLHANHNPAGSCYLSAGKMNGVTDGSLTVRAYDAYAICGYNASTGPTPLSVITTSLPAGAVNTAYSQTLSATGGTSPYTWSILSGSLPLGLTLTTATISGTPTTANTYNFTVRVTDNVAATADQALSITVAPDTTPPPQPTITANPTNPSNNSNASFSFTDTEAGITWQCKLDAEAYASCTTPKTYSGLTDASHTFSVQALDAALNASTARTYTWTVDTTAPDTIMDSTPAAVTNLTSATFTFHASETSTLQCKLDSAAYATCTSPKTYSGLTDASHTFLVRATDTAGNLDASPASYTWTVDTVPPDTIIDSQPATLTNSGSATFTFHSTESGSFQCKLDAGSYGTCTNPTGLADGSHTYSIRAIDDAGNTDPTPASFTWSIDTVVPGTCVITAPAAGTVSGIVAVSANAADNTAIAGVTFKEGPNPIGAEDTSSPYSVSWDTTGISNSTYSLTAICRDTAGNTTTSAVVLATVSNGFARRIVGGGHIIGGGRIVK